MSTIEYTIGRKEVVRSRLDLDFSFPQGTTKASASRIARIIFEYLYVGEFNPDLFGDNVQEIRGFAQATAEKPLKEDKDLNDEDIYIRALIGTYLVGVQNYGPSYMQEYARMQHRKIH